MKTIYFKDNTSVKVCQEVVDKFCENIQKWHVFKDVNNEIFLVVNTDNILYIS